MGRRDREDREERVLSMQTWADSSGGGDRTSVQAPSGMSYFALKKAGSYRVDVVPFVTNEGNPHCPEKGVRWPERTFWVHRGVGAENGTYVCPSKSLKHLGKRCPICEHRADLARKGGDDSDAFKKLMNSLAPKERQLWLVVDHAEPEKGLKLWDISFHLFGKQLKAMIQNADPTDNYNQFADVKKGFTLKLGAVEEKNQGYTFHTVKSVEFKARTGPLDKALVASAPCLDDVVTALEYDKLKDIFHQTVGGKAVAKTKSKADDSDLDDSEIDSDVDDSDVEETPKAKKGQPAKKPVKAAVEEGSDLDDDSDVDDSDVDEDDSDVEPVAPKGKKLKADAGYVPAKGDKVAYSYRGKNLLGVVKKVNDKKKLVHLEGPDGELRVMAWDEVAAAPKKAAPPPAKGGKKAADPDDSDLDDSDVVDSDVDDSDVEEAPKAKKKVVVPPSKNGKKPVKAVEEDSDVDDDDEDEDSDVEDSEVEEKPKKKVKK